MRVWKVLAVSGNRTSGGYEMSDLLSKFRLIIGALLFLVFTFGALPIAAQQPTSVNPQASAVKEQQLFQELNRISGRCTLPDQKACTIEQPAGRDWRHFHEVTLRWIGGLAVLRSEEHTSELQSRRDLVCRLLLEKKKH